MTESPVNYAEKYQWHWQWYLKLSILFMLVSWGAAIFQAFSGKLTPMSLLGLLLSTASLLPLYGFVKQKRLNPKWLWKTILVTSWIALLLMTALFGFFGLASGKFSLLLLLGFLWLYVGPQLFALREYLERSPHIWRTTEA